MGVPSIRQLLISSAPASKEYLKDPEKNKEAFENKWCSAEDLARGDEKDYPTLVDRKENILWQDS